ncbi:MAG: hypothetical protein RLZ98_3010 [Pseudomonadota bacterium]|jgi:GST-like protein
MIDLYTWKSPNGRRPIVMLEETGLPYKLITVDPYGEFSKSAEYKKFSPGGKVPCLVDPEGPEGKQLALMESSAILLYLAEKTGKFGGTGPANRWDVMRWLFYISTNVNVTFSCFRDAPALEKPLRSMMTTLDTHLASNEYFAGAYSIADMAGILRFTNYAFDAIPLSEYPNIVRWRDQLMDRPAVKHAHTVQIA